MRGSEQVIHGGDPLDHRARQRRAQFFVSTVARNERRESFGGVFWSHVRVVEREGLSGVGEVSEPGARRRRVPINEHPSLANDQIPGCEIPVADEIIAG
jgi:hypothetical protein